MDASMRIFKARFMPRNIGDLATISLIAPIQLICLYAIPAAITLTLSGSARLALYVAIGIYILFLLLSVWSISLSKDGIHFRRLLGTPRFINWQDILSVEKVSRWELVRKGWLWPMFPAREMTTCMSSIDHYRIQWKEGFCYFPPADCAAFERQVSEYKVAQPGVPADRLRRPLN